MLPAITNPLRVVSYFAQPRYLCSGLGCTGWQTRRRPAPWSPCTDRRRTDLLHAYSQVLDALANCRGNIAVTGIELQTIWLSAKNVPGMKNFAIAVLPSQQSSVVCTKVTKQTGLKYRRFNVSPRIYKIPFQSLSDVGLMSLHQESNWQA